jgi:hypothetical protein
LWALVEAAGGPDEFLDRYAVLLCSDHGQTHVRHSARLQKRFRGIEGVIVTASNRAGMVYRLDGCRLDVPELAQRLDREPSVDLVAYRDGDRTVIRQRGEELAALNGAYPDAQRRLEAALRNPNAGDILVSAAPEYEFADLGGRHHAGGGSHGSLVEGDSDVPVLLVGIEGDPRSIADFAPLVLAHFGV